MEQQESDPRRIKQETGELRIKQEHVDVIAVIVKTEDEEEERVPRFSPLGQNHTEEDGEDYGARGLVRTPALDDQTEQCSTDESGRFSESGESIGGWKESDRSSTQTNTPVLGNDVESYPDCCSPLTYKSKLLKQMCIGFEEKSFICLQCGKTFANKKNLRTHEKIHTGEKEFSCFECGKQFTQKTNLIRHEKIHTGEKPFTCSECGKAFISKCVLESHEKVHTGEKPFMCLICGKRYKQRAHLRTHSRVHSGEKPFSCSLCGKTFTRTSNLRKHEKFHSGEIV